ncbi:MAG: hypothetical protein HUU01_00580 [Saprospiraceae bacterium]|nr:hypothetical protein [Saprospiraceae bacterium]
MDDYGLKQYYAWWMLMTGAVFAFVFYLLWQMKNKEKAPTAKIEGIRWFSAALGVWCLSGLADLLVLQPAATIAPTVEEILCRSIFSSLNSMFILFAIPSIEIAEADSKGILKSIIAFARNKLGVIVSGIVFIVLTLFIFWLFRGPAGFSADNPNWYWLYVPDILFSLLTILALLFVLRTAFTDQRRHMTAMVWVVYLTIILTALAEVSLIFPAWRAPDGVFPEWLNWLRIFSPTAGYFVFYNLVATLFKMLLIALFVILLYSYEIKKAEELKMEGLLSMEEIRQRWSLEEKEVRVLRRLAKGETREMIGSDPDLFPPRTNPRKNVDDLLQNKIAPKLRLVNREVLILLFALQNKIIQFEHPQEDNFTGNPTGDNPAED